MQKTMYSQQAYKDEVVANLYKALWEFQGAFGEDGLAEVICEAVKHPRSLGQEMDVYLRDKQEDVDFEPTHIKNKLAEEANLIITEDGGYIGTDKEFSKFEELKRKYNIK